MTKKPNKIIIGGIAYNVCGLFMAKNVLAVEIDKGVQGGADAAKAEGTVSKLEDQVRNVTNILLLVIGIVAVIMLIVGGLMYIFSGGDPNNTKRAKDTILYTIVGIVVALLAYAIVTFVVGRFQG